MSAYEVPPVLAVKCKINDALTAAPEALESYADFFIFLDVLIGEGAFKYWTVQDWGKLLTLSKGVYDVLRRKPFWLRALGFNLAKVPPSFSPLSLFVIFRKEQKQKEWERSLLTTAFSEQRDPKAITQLVVSLTGEESIAMWTNEVCSLLKLSTYPTAPQAKLLGALLDIVFEKTAALSDNVTEGKASIWNPEGLLPTLKSIDVAQRNGVLYVVLVHELLMRVKDKKLLPIKDADIAALLPDVTSILQLVALSNGLIVDQLKDEKWVLTRKNLSHATRRAVVMSLASLSFLGLADAFKKKGLFKKVAKNIHLGDLVNRALAKEPNHEGLIQLRLFLGILRGVKYPSAEKFEEYKAHYIVPLRTLCETNPLFEVQKKEFLELEFKTELVNRPLPKPRKRTVEALLAQEGNTVQSWTNLFNRNVVTASQVLMNMRSLILLDYPLETVKKLLEAKLESLDTLKILKLRQFLAVIFDQELLRVVEEQRDQALKNTPGKDYLGINMPPQIFKDAKGTTIEKQISRNVAVTFGQDTIDRYLGLITALFAAKTDAFKPTVSPNRVRSVIVYTSETANAMRTGMPPSIPPYSRTSLWRNEGICLQQLALPGEQMSSLRLGMTWCEAPGSKERVDLDLSVLLYDANWAFVDHCSYSKRRLTGCIHSGDFTSAPYPGGAREAVDIDFPQFLKGYPQVKYLVIMVYAYSGQSMDDLYDGSVFVANPQKVGTGPGGTEIISAARLTGKGTANCAGFVALDCENPDDMRYTFYCVDQTFNDTNRNATSSYEKVATELQRITKNVAMENPPYVRLSLLSAYYAAITSDSVTLAHRDGEVTVEKDTNETRVEFFNRIAKTMSGLREAINSNVPQVPPADKNVDHLIVFGGELVTPAQVLLANPTYANPENPAALSLVNLRADVAKSAVKLIGKSPITIMTSTDILQFLGA